MTYITTDYILDNHTDIDGWRPQVDMSYSLSWYNPKSDYYIYATPNWVNDGEVPIQVANMNNGDVRDMWDLVFQTNSPLQTQFEQYVQAIRNVIQLLNK